MAYHWNSLCFHFCLFEVFLSEICMWLLPHPLCKMASQGYTTDFIDFFLATLTAFNINVTPFDLCFFEPSLSVDITNAHNWIMRCVDVDHVDTCLRTHPWPWLDSVFIEGRCLFAQWLYSLLGCIQRQHLFKVGV